MPASSRQRSTTAGAAGVGGVKMESVVKGVAPFLLVYALLLVLLVAFPQIVIAPVHWLG